MNTETEIAWNFFLEVLFIRSGQKFKGIIVSTLTSYCSLGPFCIIRTLCSSIAVSLLKVRKVSQRVGKTQGAEHNNQLAGACELLLEF